MAENEAREKIAVWIQREDEELLYAPDAPHCAICCDRAQLRELDQRTSGLVLRDDDAV